MKTNLRAGRACMNVRLTLFDSNTFVLLWEYYSKHKNSIIYVRKQEGLYQNKVTSSLVSFCHCKWPSVAVHLFFMIFLI